MSAKPAWPEGRPRIADRSWPGALAPVPRRAPVFRHVLLLGGILVVALAIIPRPAAAARYFRAEEVAEAHALRARVLDAVPGLDGALHAAQSDAPGSAAAVELLARLEALGRTEADNPFYHWAVGELRRRDGDARAAADFALASNAAKNKAAIHWILWEEYLARDQTQEAEREQAALQDVYLSWGLARFPRLADRLVREARLATARGAHQKAIANLERAMRLDPYQAGPPLLMARILWEVSKRNAPKALRYLTEGVRLAWRHHGTRQLILGNLLENLIIAFLLSLVVLAFILSFRSRGLLLHDLRHGLQGRLAPRAQAVLLGALALPVVLGLGVLWSILLVLVLVSPYLRVRERLAISMLMVALSLLPAAYRGVARLQLLAGSPFGALAEEVEAGARGDEILERIQQWARQHPTNHLPLYYLGLLHKRRGDLAAALQDLQQATDLAPGRSAPWVALGNVLYLQGDKDRALEAYAKAMAIPGSSAPAHLNAGFIYIERFDLERARREMEDAFGIDLRLASAVSAPRIGRPDGFMADERLGALELRDPLSPGAAEEDVLAAALWSGTLRGVPLQALPLAAMAVLSAFWGLGRWGRGLAQARACERCGKVFCPRCQTSMPAERVCAACAAMGRLQEGIPVALKIQRRRDAASFQDRRRHLAGTLAVLLPGAGHLYLGRALGGILLLLPSLFILSELIAGVIHVSYLRIPSDMRWLAGGLTAVPLLLVLCAVSALRCARLLEIREAA